MKRRCRGALLFQERGNREVGQYLRDREECVLYGEDDLESLLTYYLEHEEERRALAQRACERVGDFTFETLWSQALETVEREWPSLIARVGKRMAYELFSTTLVWYGIAFQQYIKDQAKHHTGWCSNLVALAPRWQAKLREEEGFDPFYVRTPLGSMDNEAVYQGRRASSVWLLAIGWLLSTALAGAAGAGVFWLLLTR